MPNVLLHDLSQQLRELLEQDQDYPAGFALGRHILRFDYIFKDTHHVREAQVVQDRPDGIRIVVVRRTGYSTDDEALIREEIRRRVSERLQVSFEYVDEIPREANGKFRAVKSLLR